jgi:hypothetical protein
MFAYGNPAPSSVRAYQVLKHWEEMNSSWNEAVKGSESWGEGGCNEVGVDRGGEVIDEVELTDEAYQYPEWDLTSVMQIWVNDPGTNHGIVLIGRVKNLYSRNHYKLKYRPSLEVVYLAQEVAVAETEGEKEVEKEEEEAVKEERGKELAPAQEGEKEEKKEETKELPGKMELGSSYPNPFNPESWLPFELPVEERVLVRIYNVLGQLVREMELGRKGAGYYHGRERAIYWDGRDNKGQSVPGGIYFCQLIAGEKVMMRRMVILK